MGAELASMGFTEPAEERDEIIQFTGPKTALVSPRADGDGFARLANFW
jgi:hypothetical protein